MSIIELFHKTNLTRRVAVIIAGLAIVSWFLGGAPIPGRYQIISNSSTPQLVISVDTMTGKIRVFGARGVGSSAFPEIEVVELTK